MKENQVYKDIMCQDLTTDFVGTAMIEGKKVFIDNFLPRETGNIIITEIRSKFVKGRVVQLTTSSSMRQDSLVERYPEHFFGGCDLHTINYPAQVKIKQQLVEKLAKLQDRDYLYTFSEMTAAPEPLYYRNKMHYQLYVGADGKIKAGFYRRGTRELVEAQVNVLAHPKIAKMLTYVTHKLNERGIQIADKASQSHGLKTVMFRYSQKRNQMLIIFIASTKYVKGVERVAKEMQREYNIVKSVYLNVNGKNHGNVLGDKSTLLAGNVSIDDEMLGLEFLVTPQAFYQVNETQTVNLYEQIKTWVQKRPHAHVLDLYTGTGAIALFLARHVKAVTGVDIVDDAIRIANINAKNNAVANVQFEQADVEQFMTAYKKIDEELITIIDPPRNGCSSTFIHKLVEVAPTEIIYISCNPKTLIRDLRQFRQLGYTQKEIKLYDMFPETLHVESAVLLSREDV